MNCDKWLLTIASKKPVAEVHAYKFIYFMYVKASKLAVNERSEGKERMRCVYDSVVRPQNEMSGHIRRDSLDYIRYSFHPEPYQYFI